MNKCEYNYFKYLKINVFFKYLQVLVPSGLLDSKKFQRTLILAFQGISATSQNCTFFRILEYCASVPRGEGNFYKAINGPGPGIFKWSRQSLTIAASA